VQSTLAKLSLCRTPALGGKQYACDSCGQTESVHHSCGDRHCPICSGRKRYDFAERAEQLILDGVTYYQVVFTLPSELSELALANRKAMSELLCSSAWKALKKSIGTEQNFDPAAMMVLHTWNQQLDAHWHVHALVPGGGPSLSGLECWKHAEAPEGAANSDGYYLVDTTNLREEFRKVAIAHLRRLRKRDELKLGGKYSHLNDDAEWNIFCAKLESVTWVSYTQPPPNDSCTADQVVRYLTRYLTGGPISDHRIVAADEHEVTFMAREGCVTGGERAQVPVTVSRTEFIRRWCLHIQPSQLTKTRYFGGWCSRRRTQYLQTCQELLGSTEFDPAEFESMDAFVDPELAESDGTNFGEETEMDQGDPAAPWCSQCDSERMRLTGEIPKPSWHDILRHTDSRCPSWYAEREQAAWIRHLDEEHGIDYETWCLELGIESAIGRDELVRPASPDRRATPTTQFYFAGLQPHREFQLESF